MKSLFEGEKRNIRAKVSPLDGSTPISLASPERRILDAQLQPLYDWEPAVWDSQKNIIYAIFDSTLSPLAQPGNYYMQLRGTIGFERYGIRILVKVKEWGP